MATTRTATRLELRALTTLVRRTVTVARLLACALAIEGAALLVPAPAVAQVIRFTPSLGVDETFTTNVRLSDKADAQSDFLTQLTPSFTISETGGHVKLSGYVLVPILVYARTGAGNDTVQPQVNLTGSAELIDKLFFLDASVYVQQEYESPYAARPTTFSTGTGNGFTLQTYTVSPYLRSTRGDYDYELRDTNIWTTSTGVTGSTPTSSYSNEIVGRASRQPVPVGWTLDFDRSDVKFPDQGALVSELERARVVWEADPELELSAGGGYEDNRYTLATYKDTIYNAGFRWRPTERTVANGDWEHRYFGASYHFAFDHRTPLSVWSVRASRDTTSYPQQLATLPAGSSVAVLLNQLLLTSIPDPVARQAYIDQLIRNGSLPLLTAGAVSLFTQQILLQENASASLGLLGARNSVFFSLFRLRSQPVAGTGAAPNLESSLTNNTQTGGSIVLTHNLTPSLSLNASADYLRTLASPPFAGKTDQGTLRLTLTTPLTANTSAYLGGRYQRLRSDLTNDYEETAIFIGMTHVFH